MAKKQFSFGTTDLVHVLPYCVFLSLRKSLQVGLHVPGARASSKYAHKAGSIHNPIDNVISKSVAIIRGDTLQVFVETRIVRKTKTDTNQSFPETK